MEASPAGSGPAAPLLEVRHLSKSFAGVRALKDVNLAVLPGEVHCVLGQNGAGKSTLIKALSGVHRPDGGEILWNGEPVELSGPMAALDLGIATMYQELDVVDGLNVAENIFLGHEDARAGVLRVKDARRRARELLTRLGHADLSPTAEVGSLSAANKQIVSLARALSRNARLIIMDEPSAILDSGEVANLFRVIRELTAQDIAVVYISHRLEEIRQIGSSISVIKDGYSTASSLPVAATTREELVRLMTGRDVANVFPARAPVPAEAPVVLQVQGLGLAGSFRDVSFSVRAGEVFGLAGLVGSGRSEILETVFGARKATAGTVTVTGKELRPGSVPASISAGIGLSPEERKSQGLLLEEPIFVNATLSTFARFARRGLLNERREKAAAREQLTALQVDPQDPDRPARTLSGGNQQKVLLGRWLIHGTRVLLLDEPTRGVDVGAKTEIYALIRALAANGVAVVVVSSEIEEVIGLADRVLVLDAGQVLAIRNAEDIDEHAVLDLVLKGSAQ
ncbi:sugar ABC transporter ATP-binding protein [Arthrobacter jiangjiafuii]|uniref:Sugar ABC transporter ATP-binding protein n=1 Tax=Arthrobacter jiangjiafuii TaxID=2817475 RepID=A0A975M781_9MICC|nr:sugar ABC transporter ATP-binding protein [Arthrobacter jiangjiafuii]MBP3043671.1 sugar ABC transporter ATP-binding protein [Arthrobacter jiangjiafuii]QWC10706.1 sugar ABC transporter ATP-binding protein [Arthrobacter jiangjiafuii]